MLALSRESMDMLKLIHDVVSAGWEEGMDGYQRQVSMTAPLLAGTMEGLMVPRSRGPGLGTLALAGLLLSTVVFAGCAGLQDCRPVPLCLAYAGLGVRPRLCVCLAINLLTELHPQSLHPTFFFSLPVCIASPLYG